MVRNRIYIGLLVLSFVLSFIWNVQDLFSYWGTGLLTMGVYGSVLFLAFGEMQPEEQFFYGPALFFGIWFLGYVLAHGVGPYPGVDKAVGEYISSIAVTSGVLFVLASVRKYFGPR